MHERSMQSACKQIYGSPKLTKSDGTNDIESDVKWQNGNQDKQNGVETQLPVEEPRAVEEHSEHTIQVGPLADWFIGGGEGEKGGGAHRG